MEHRHELPCDLIPLRMRLITCRVGLEDEGILPVGPREDRLWRNVVSVRLIILLECLAAEVAERQIPD